MSKLPKADPRRQSKAKQDEGEARNSETKAEPGKANEGVARHSETQSKAWTSKICNCSKLPVGCRDRGRDVA